MDNLIPPRNELIKRAKEEHFDCVIIGGGITGASVLRDLSLRGLNACLVEKNDFAYGTSSMTSKMIHGGLRYLKNYEFGLVREAALERKIAVNNAPHMAEVMDFLVPIYRWNKESPFLMRIGLILYDILSIPKRIGRHKMLSISELVGKLPILENKDIRGGAIYQDVKTDDARFTLLNILSGVAGGGVALNYTIASNWMYDEEKVEVEVNDLLNNDRYTITGDVLIICGGPWTEIIESKGANFKGKAKLRLTRGTHLLIEDVIKTKYSALLINDDDRPIFIVPQFNNKILVGTTDVDFPDIPDKVKPTNDDIEYILNALQKIFPKANISKSNILSAFAGVRPLVSKKGVSEGKVSRKHSIFVKDNIITLAGGKLTTSRVMAKQAVDRALKILNKRKLEYKCHTHLLPLFGGEIDNWEEFLEEHTKRLMNEYKLSEGSAKMCVHWYGSELPYFETILKEHGTTLLDNNNIWLEAQVIYSCRVEFAQHPIDFLRRRTQIMFERGNGLQVLDRVVELMKKELNWNEETANTMKNETINYINNFVKIN